MKRTIIFCVTFILIMLIACSNQNTNRNDNYITSNACAGNTIKTSSIISSASIDSIAAESKNEIDILESVIEDEQLESYDTETLIGDPWEPLYPNEEYPIATNAPYDISIYADSVANTKELMDFINNTDENTYRDGYYFSFFKASRDIGYVLKPKFDGIELDEMIASKQAYGIGLGFEEKYAGPSYYYSLDTENYKHKIVIHPLKKDWVEDTQKRPFMYQSGKKMYMGWEFSKLQEDGWTKHKIQDGKYTVYKDNYSIIHWAYDDYLIEIVSTTYEDRPTVLDTAEKLTFEKVLLNQSDE